MKFGDKEIADMTLQELRTADAHLDNMLQNRRNREADPRWIKRGVPSGINPTFEQMQSLIKEQITKRAAL